MTRPRRIVLRLVDVLGKLILGVLWLLMILALAGHLMDHEWGWVAYYVAVFAYLINQDRVDAWIAARWTAFRNRNRGGRA